MKKLLKQATGIGFGIMFLLAFLSACQRINEQAAKQATKPAMKIEILENKKAYTACKSPRRNMCTKEYRPVCALKDTGVRCVTTPCPSSVEVTYGNSCTACADEKVLGYTQGACEK